MVYLETAPCVAAAEAALATLPLVPLQTAGANLFLVTPLTYLVPCVTSRRF